LADKNANVRPPLTLRVSVCVSYIDLSGALQGTTDRAF